MRLPRLRIGRELLGRYLAGAALLICTATMLLMIVSQQRQHEKELDLSRAGVWAAYQAEFELLRLLRTLDLYAVSKAAHDELMLRFDIFWSRILIMNGDDAGGRLIRYVADPRRIHDEVIPVLERLEPAFRSLKPHDEATYEEIRATLEPFAPRLHAISSKVAWARTEEILQTNESRLSIYAKFGLPLLGVLASVAGLVFLALKEAHRARALLTETEKARATATRAGELLRTVIDAVPAVIAAVDEHGRLLFANRGHGEFFGHDPEAAIGRSPAELGADRLYGDALMVKAATSLVEKTIPDVEGRERVLLASSVPVRNHNQQIECVVHVSLDITERRQAEKRVHHLAHHDALTNLPNRVLLLERLRQSVAGAFRHDYVVAVHCIDLDRFKEVNDTLGHPIGDALLVAAAGRMQTCLREYDTLARLGGDEFAVIQDHLTDPMDAAAVARRLVQELARPFSIDGHEIMISASVGSSLAPTDAVDVHDLMRQADLALYRAKSDGRNRSSFFAPEMAEQLEARKHLEQDMRRALENGGFSLAFQPKHKVVGHTTVGCEALLRWTHPVLGPISPSRFVPVAEDTGLIVPLGAWVIEEACRQIAAWQAEGLGSLAVAVNLSMAQFGREDLARGIEAAVRRAGIDPSLLELEVTESVLVRSTEEALGFIRRMRALGVRVALDDFGTGYSSLSYLQRFPFDKLKIDRSFIANLGQSRTSDAIVQSLIQLAHTLGMDVVAEGVETPAQLMTLAALGCDEAQGFLFSPPLSADELAAMLHHHRSRSAAPSSRTIRHAASI